MRIGRRAIVGAAVAATTAGTVLAAAPSAMAAPDNCTISYPDRRTGRFMKRLMTGLAVAATALTATVAIAGSAHADPTRPPGVPANYVYYKTIPGGEGDCNDAGLYFEQQGLIKYFVCDNVQPPGWDTGGYSNLWAVLA